MKQVKKFFAIILMLIVASSVFSQNVTDVESQQVGNKIEITYSLDKEANIEIQVSENNGGSFKTILNVSGDVGKNISAGCKKIVWDVLDERDKLQGNEIVFKVIASKTLSDSEWVLINGVKWATRNVAAPGTFAAKPEDPGMFYQWNRKVGWSATNPMKSSNSSTSWNSSNVAGNTWSKANDPCPPGWRVPTRTECQSLVNASSQWTTVNGVNGRIFGNGNNTLFLPAAGYRYNTDGSLTNRGSYGYYWSSAVSVTSARYLYFNSSMQFMVNGNSSTGFSVRCVAE